MLMQLFQKYRFLRMFVDFFGIPRAKDMASFIKPYLNKDDKILDIGAGFCYLPAFLQKENYTVVPIDIENCSFIPEIKPIIYDGNTIPFSDKSFDVSFIIGVFHHIPIDRQYILLKEAMRVSKKIIVIEDIYYNWLDKQLLFFFDTVYNLHFFNHPHSNKSDGEWRRFFHEFGLKVHDVKYMNWVITFNMGMYELVK